MKTFSTPPARLPEHLQLFQGNLHNNRHPWQARGLRFHYSWHYRDISRLKHVKAVLRAGPVAWPGCYPLFLITKDGVFLCFACAIKEFRKIVWDFQQNCSTGWRVSGCDTNWEDSSLHCDHCSQPIPSAYGEPEEKEEASPA